MKQFMKQLAKAVGACTLALGIVTTMGCPVFLFKDYPMPKSMQK